MRIGLTMLFFLNVCLLQNGLYFVQSTKADQTSKLWIEKLMDQCRFPGSNLSNGGEMLVYLFVSGFCI